MKTIVVMELKGFAKISEDLGLKMDIVGLDSSRIRAAVILTVNEIIKATEKECATEYTVHIGGDTWFFVLGNVAQGIKFGCVLLNKFMALVNQKGLFYLKPSLAMSIGEPKWQDGRFLDDESIKTYRLADTGYPFSFYILDKIYTQAKSVDWVKIVNIDSEKYSIDWINSIADDAGPIDIEFPPLLLDSELLYMKTLNESLNAILRLQSKSQSIVSFGGPIPMEVPYFKDYIKATIAHLTNNPDCKITVLSYIPLKETLNSFAWLELSRKLCVKFPQNAFFAAFVLPEGQIRPMAYQIFDNQSVYIGLRSYSPQRGGATMDSAIMFKNDGVAKKFYDNFLEEWRMVGPLDDEKFADICKQLGGITSDIKSKAYNMIDSLFVI